MPRTPRTLLEAVQYFSDSKTCVEYLKHLRWADGVVTCPRCNSTHVKELSTRQVWKCYSCKKQFSVKVGTIFEQSPLPLSKWLPAMWIIANAKNGVSSCEIARSIGVGQKTAWFMMHRIREAMQNGSFVKMTGVVEVDESYVGGSDTNRHASKKRNVTGRGHDKSKAAVLGIVERGGQVVAKVIDDASERTLKGEIHAHVEKGAVLYSDQWTAYQNLHSDFFRDTVNHAKKQYVKGDTHTNTIEGYWSLFKRTLNGTYIHVAPFHLDRYLREQSFRYNLRKGDDHSRFNLAASQVHGQRLTWKELTGSC